MELKQSTVDAVFLTTSEDIGLEQSNLGRRTWSAGILVAGLMALVAWGAGLGIGVLSAAGVAAANLTTLGTLLLAASFPLFYFAAHCLDRAAGEGSGGDNDGFGAGEL